MNRPTFNKRTRRWLLLLALSLIGGVMLRGLFMTSYSTSALLYLGYPWLVAVALALTTLFDKPELAGQSAKSSNVRGALIVMLGSSFLVGEGFICVLMFLPIYLFVVIMVFVITAIGKARARRKGNSNLHAIHLLPLLFLLLALEGTHPNLTFERQGSVEVTKVTSITKQQLWANLRKPMVLNRSASSGLSRLFPQPYQIDIDSFEPDKIHTVHYRYARWLWTNVHEGALQLRIDKVTDKSITASVVSNTSYLANYLDIERFTLKITDHSQGKSEVSIRINYRRTLDPAWYFSPLIRVALQGTASHVIKSHLLKEGKNNA